MISFVKGKLYSINENAAVVESSSIGYEIFCTTSDIAKMNSKIGSEILLFTQLVHREDSMTLYGFLKEKTKQGFLSLQKVSGIGAKLALKILSVYEPDELFAAVEKEDVKFLEQIPGIGQKMAKKIIFDLKGVIPAESEDTDSNEKDLIAAMVNLGYKENDIRFKMKDIKPLGDNFEDNFKKLLKLMAAK